jgi:hypothetical protein
MSATRHECRECGVIWPTLAGLKECRENKHVLLSETQRLAKRLDTAFDMLETVGKQVAALRETVTALAAQADKIERRTVGLYRFGGGP